MIDSLKKEALKKHYEWKGKIETKARVDVFSKENLSMAYTPGVAEACMKIHEFEARMERHIQDRSPI